MLFRRNIEPACSHCGRGTRLSEREIVCAKRGIVPAEFHCWRFRYDPLKRIPPRPASLRIAKFREEDFTL